ncbi:hypothetical protein [Allonocardiopsis opalescens]|uniref:Uncharacterized protein n=1 Tax=Allonocardiopsis opalescens TaxID=1144618 RepID=A0A2T0QF91_9ACTN|nr:hypothetical protein [Allonocardiopsis opalescens]PRY02575.1 hypothetical protein CLV72_1011178 [Allonocardiopsis opalescens]
MPENEPNQSNDPTASTGKFQRFANEYQHQSEDPIPRSSTNWMRYAIPVLVVAIAVVAIIAWLL